MTVDAQILAALRNADSVSGADLANQLGISRAAIWSRIEDLRHLGYDIAASPHHGYRLLGAPDLLHADDLQARLVETRTIGRDIRVFRETASTNDLAERLARDGAGEGVVVFAESQSKGRGRMGRQWVSPHGKGLWFSVLLRPPIRPHEATRLTVAAATSMVRAIHEFTEVLPEIKWPNDLMIGGKKLAGVLTEMSAELDSIRHLILGIGLDVNVEKSDLPAGVHEIATSLKIATGKSIHRPELATRILRELDFDYTRILSGRFDEITAEWEARCTTIGQRVVIDFCGKRVSGFAEALDYDGALLLRTDHGRRERITGGDVMLAK